MGGAFSASLASILSCPSSKKRWEKTSPQCCGEGLGLGPRAGWGLDLWCSPRQRTPPDTSSACLLQLPDPQAGRGGPCQPKEQVRAEKAMVTETMMKLRNELKALKEETRPPSPRYVLCLPPGTALCCCCSAARNLALWEISISAICKEPRAPSLSPLGVK